MRGKGKGNGNGPSPINPIQLAGGTASGIRKKVPSWTAGKTGTAHSYNTATFASILGKDTVCIIAVYMRHIPSEERRRNVQGGSAAKFLQFFYKHVSKDTFSPAICSLSSEKKVLRSS